MQDFWNHPQHTARDRWRTVESPDGSIDTLLPPANIKGVDTKISAIPAVGEHTQLILKQLGYNEDDIKRLTGDNVI